MFTENRILHLEGETTAVPENKKEAAEKAVVKKNTAAALGNFFQQPGTEKLLKNAENRLGMTPEAYHKQVLLIPGQPEVLGQHFGRVHLSPNNGQPKTLIIVIGGNEEPLTQPLDRLHSYRGGMFLYDNIGRMSQQKTDVLHLKSGSTFGAATNGNSVALAHIRNLVQDALDAQGVFAGRSYTNLRMCGFSYGAGACQIVHDMIQGRQKQAQPVPTIDRTVYIDGIQFQSIPPVALTARPALSGNHYHLWQQSDWVINGAAPTPAGQKKWDEAVKFSQTQKGAIDHRSFNDASHNVNNFDSILSVLTQNTQPPAQQ